MLVIFVFIVKVPTEFSEQTDQPYDDAPHTLSLRLCLPSLRRKLILAASIQDCLSFDLG